VNRWAARHADALGRELEPGETLLAAHRVVVSGAERGERDDGADDVADTPARWGGRGAPARRGLNRRVSRARELGFAVPSGIFVLGVSDRRLLLWEGTAALARPNRLAGSIPLGDVAVVRVMRRLGRVRLAVLREDRGMLVLGPLWSRQLEDLAAAFEAATH
jgi:hypothetical protein